MPNSLRIIKADGTSHIVPLGSINRHRRIDSILPVHLRSRFEEINERGNVIQVHAEGARGEALAGQNEIARLKAENARLREMAADSDKGEVKKVVEKINAATTLKEVQDLSLNDGRPAVMKAAIAKSKTFSKE